MNNFIEMSKYAGMREDLVQAGGGNSAYKISRKRMVIKASGYLLADVNADRGYAVVDPQVIRNAFLSGADLEGMSKADAKKILAQAFIEGERPSIETFLHVVSGRYSLHTHPIVVNILTCRAGGMDTLQEMFPEALMVPYATPGVELAKVYFKQYQQHGKDISVVFLQNHGLLVSAETADEAMEKTEQTVRRIEEYLHMDMSAYHAVTQLYRVCNDGIIWRVTDQNVRQAQEALGRVWDSAFCPDCVVFLGKRMFDAGDRLDAKELDRFRAAYGEPAVIAYQKEIYLHAPSVKKALEMQSVLSFSAQVMLANAGHECHTLSRQEQDFLLGWDAEKYRKNIR